MAMAVRRTTNTTRQIWRRNRGEAKGANAENLAKEFESSAQIPSEN